MAVQDPGVGSWTPINIWAMIRALVNNGCPIVTNSGAPTSGTSGTFAGQAGKGAILIDYTNGNIYFNAGTLTSPTWLSLGGSNVYFPQALAVNTAISPLVTAQYAITKASAEANTLAAPAASPGGDGIEIMVFSDTAFAHTITATGLLDTGTAATNVITFNAFKGASVTLVSYNGRWKVVAQNGVTFS